MAKIPRMTENLVFLKGLQAHTDRLKSLLGPEWEPFQRQLWTYLQKLLNNEDDDLLQLWIDQILEIGLKSRAGPLVRALRDQARQTGESGQSAVLIKMFDPTTAQSRDVEVAAEPGQGKLKEAGRELIRSLAAMSPGEVKMSDADEESAQRVETYPYLQGDDYACLQQIYRLTVKLSDQPPPDPGDHLDAPPVEVEAEAGELTKTIQVRLFAPDFDLHPDDTASGWQRELTLYLEARASGSVTFQLLARDRLQAHYFAALKLQFLVEGEPIGEASRQVQVLQDETVPRLPLDKFPPAPTYPLDERGDRRLPGVAKPHRRPLDFRKPPARPDQIHLTVTIAENSRNREKLDWQFASPYLQDKELPPGDSDNLGRAEYVKEYLAPFGMPGHWNKPHMDEHGHLFPASIPTLLGNLLQLRHHAPSEFWQAYEKALYVHQWIGQPPETFNILFHTADTHIPWELMPISEEVVDDRLPLLLGSAHRVGRWMLGVEPYRPPRQLALTGLALAAPIYTDRPLPQAQAEREFIKKYQPRPLLETPVQFRQFMLSGEPTGGAGILHFAGHGDCCTDPTRGNWLVLSDSNGGDWYDIHAAGNDAGNRLGKLGQDVLAFFNACNVGRTAEGPLGSNGGWGRALLHQQYRGYIGPLWSVYDVHALDISRMFYSLALDEKQPLGEVMRQIRLKFAADNRLFTYLAYIYLGHPMAQISYTPQSQEDDHA